MHKKEKQDKTKYLKLIAEEYSLDIEKVKEEFESFEGFLKLFPGSCNNFREWLDKPREPITWKERLHFSEMENPFGDEDFWFEDKLGRALSVSEKASSIDDAVKICGTKHPYMGFFAEMVFISDRFGVEDSDWFYERQEHLTKNNIAYDVLTIRLSDDSLVKVYFDISEFNCKWTV